MPLTELIALAATTMRRQFEDDATGHDWWHLDRVRRTARRLGELEGANPDMCELAGLLHDIADWKFHEGDLAAGPQAARAWLESQSAPAPVVEEICQIVAEVTFKGAGVDTPMSTLAGRCVQDADRLDAIGAIGIARAFTFGGACGRTLYDPEHPPTLHDSFAAYQQKQGPTINHFYEKLLLLKDRMQTATGRRIAEERHAFLEQFLTAFFAEWNADGHA